MKPSLDLSVVARDPSGVEVTWDANDPDPGRRPQNLRFSAKRGEGFSEGGAQLARLTDRDYFDLRLLNDIVVTGSGGRIPWEGRFAGRPGSADSGGHSISPALVGWMSHAKSQRISEVYADRDLSRWGDMPLNEKARLAAAAVDFASISWSTGDPAEGLVCALPNQALGAQVDAQAWYAAPTGVLIAKAMYVGADTTVPGGWVSPRLGFTNSDSNPPGQTLTFDGTLRTITATTAGRFAVAEIGSAGTAATPAAGASRRFTKLALYGTHGLTTRTVGATDPDGLWLSDIIKDIGQRWAPKLSMAGVQENQIVVSQAVYDAVFPYDAWLELNNLALWELACWENKTLHYYPADLTDYDWEVRIGDPGVSVSLQGDTIDELWNGVEVSYDDIDTGRRERLTPDAFPELADPDPDNPANQQGEKLWQPLELPFPASQGNALQYGRVKLAESLAPKGIGTVEVEGHVRDRAGHWQPAYMMRPGETIAITNHSNDRPRLIVESDYDDPSKRMRLAIDTTFQILEAYFDRALMALSAAGLR